MAVKRKDLPNTREGRYIEPPRQLDSGAWVMHVLPWELKPGDRVIGMTAGVVAGPRYSETDVGSYAERARYTYTLTDGQELPYSGDSPAVGVIRATAT